MKRSTVVLMAAGATAFAAVTTAVGAASGAPLEFLALDAVTGLSFVAAGLFAAWYRPASPAGPLLIASGALWFVGSYGPTLRPVLTTLGFAFEGYYDLTLAILLLLLSAPGNPLRPRPLVLALAGAMAVRSAGRLFLQDPAVFLGPGSGFPPNPFAIATDPELFAIVETGSNLVMAILFVVVGLVGVSRLIGAGTVARRSRWPVLVAGSLAMTGATWRAFDYAWSTGTETAVVELAPPIDYLLGWAVFALRVLVPIAFLLGVLRQRRAVGPLAPLAAHLGGPDAASTMGAAVRTALGDPSLDLLRACGDGTWLAEDGRTVALPGPETGRSVTTVGSSDAPAAALVHDPAVLEHPELLAGVIPVLRLALENERLEAALRTQLEEVTASRARIVTATEEERRRLERDLHDGAQQRLVAVSLALNEARAIAGSAEAPGPLRDHLDALSNELAGAIRELRELARGIHPAILEHEGLGPAVAGLARRASVPVEVHVEVPERLPAVVESTAYFTIAEALTNTQRHAGASHARISAVSVDQHLELEIADDGIGGADPRRGSGLRGLDDRMTALGGTLTIDSRAGKGTTVRASLPVQ
ncbi:MAG: histidine kinase [Chloroflexota bacterium]|jgi:signal transduction histidine kinase|nr:histidine kinase [Chloroflexota bacterium]MDH5243782.1 histidine kinase [Chloroflexota bacterium]